MLTLLFAVLVLGVLAWALGQIPIPEPFKTIAYAILLIMLLIVIFRAIGGDIPQLR